MTARQLGRLGRLGRLANSTAVSSKTDAVMVAKPETPIPRNSGLKSPSPQKNWNSTWSESFCPWRFSVPHRS